jgi:hypothetical protein
MNNQQANTATSDVAYEAPMLRIEGNVRDLTNGLRTGDYIDADFPAHTPVSSLTFS